jgi:nucleoside-diphosphate-sugar epimerase
MAASLRMRILVTGAGGCVGRQVVGRLADHTVIAIDRYAENVPALPHVIPLVGDLCDRRVLSVALAEGCDAVVHLATVPGGAAEEAAERAWRVNVDGTMMVAGMASEVGRQPRFVFASSIAVFGERLPATVDDATTPAPTMLYGAHKAMMELWLAALTRRRELDAISVRLPGIVARSGMSAGLKSAFLSDLFHATREGRSFLIPVSPEATCWLQSVECAAENICHAIFADMKRAPACRAVTLPATRTRVNELVAEVAAQTRACPGSVSYVPDEKLESTFGRYPPLATPCADALGFVADGSLGLLVSNALAALGTGADLR